MAEPTTRVISTERSATADDAVNHPAHYNRHPSGVECITVVEHMGFSLGNAVKYIWRADLKADALEDLRKAAWYLNREITRRQRAQAQVEEAACRVCGCTENRACPGGCWWVPDPQMGDLCSACRDRAPEFADDMCALCHAEPARPQQLRAGKLLCDRCAEGWDHRASLTPEQLRADDEAMVRHTDEAAAEQPVDDAAAPATAPVVEASGLVPVVEAGRDADVDLVVSRLLATTPGRWLTREEAARGILAALAGAGRLVPLGAEVDEEWTFRYRLNGGQPELAADGGATFGSREEAVQTFEAWQRHYPTLSYTDVEYLRRVVITEPWSVRGARLAPAPSVSKEA